MKYTLHPDQLAHTRQAILQRFRELRIKPDGIAHVEAFAEVWTTFTGVYYHAALQQLANEKVVELLPPDGRYYCLTTKGHARVEMLNI